MAPDDGRVCMQLHGMPEMVTGLAFTCDARALVAAGSDAALRMWDLTSGRVRHTLTGHVAKARSLTRTRHTREVFMHHCSGARLLCGCVCGSLSRLKNRLGAWNKCCRMPLQCP